MQKYSWGFVQLSWKLLLWTKINKNDKFRMTNKNDPNSDVIENKSKLPIK